jgi:hypothetical protein
LSDTRCSDTDTKINSTISRNPRLLITQKEETSSHLANKCTKLANVNIKSLELKLN